MMLACSMPGEGLCGRTEALCGGDLERAPVRNLAVAGRAALSLVPGAGAALKQTLLALRGACSWPSTTLWGTDAPGPAQLGAAVTSKNAGS
jgi:hypothetical protein